jgi:hypothetical protein
MANPMRLKFKVLLPLFLLGMVHTSLGFALLGPFKTWQVAQLGYQINGQIGGPMTPLEFYRWNVPVITYAFDSSFIRYFGTNGINEVEKAIKIIQDLPPVDQIQNVTNISFFGPPVIDLLNTNGEIFPRQAYGPSVNNAAAEMRLTDLKSMAMFHLMEELGLADPFNWLWALRQRTVFPGPIIDYGVVNYNYDPITLKPSTNLNGIYYGFTILDIPGIADAVENFSLTDPLLSLPVASGFVPFGAFYERLSFDDVGGLRFLYSTNNIVTETLLNTGGTTVLRGSGSALGGSPWSIVFGPTNVGTNTLSFTNLFNPSNVVNQVLRPGIGKLNFFRVEYDSLIGQNFVTVTNLYTDTYISNLTVLHQPLLRVIRQPDILFSVSDLGGAFSLPFFTSRTTAAGWVDNSALNSHGVANAGLFGPGIITPQVEITFMDTLPWYLNENPFFIDDTSFLFVVGAWGSFDGSTNAPIVYPQFMDMTLDTIRTVLTNHTTVIRY